MEADAGAGRLISRHAPSANAGKVTARRRRRWLAAIAAVLTLLAGGITVGGFWVLRAHRASQAITRANAAAVAAAEDCVAATQPADLAALSASQRKLDECATGAFQTQAAWYSAILTEAYQAQNIHVQLPEMHAAVERTNDDGSVVALVVFRAKISQEGMADRENSYRIRVTMVRANGHFKIAQLDQVAK